MINYIPFYTKIWSDKRFKKLSVSGKLLFIYLFANESIGLTGIYELDLDTCKIKVKINSDFDEVFLEIKNSQMIEFDTETDIIFVINRFKLIPNKSPKVIAGVVNELNQIKHPFKDKFIKIYESILITEKENYLVNLNGYNEAVVDLLTKEQISTFVKIGNHKGWIKNFYIHRGYPEVKIDEIINTYFPNLK